ncbi:ribonucleotide-diphosphate reductase [Bacillus phage vB_BceM-HSE3]|nr:ribonucleotide-diphosphate reductase [Bacillus phage vB_BceM-HSE3]
MVLKSVNWNKKDDDYTQDFWKQNIEQFWVEDEISVSDDKTQWDTQMTPAEKLCFQRVLSGLTRLDVNQGGEGMPLIALHTKNLQQKAVLMFMAAMEEIHAKSYSYIFTTLITEEEIQEQFDWADTHPTLVYKNEVISSYYMKLFSPHALKTDLYMAMVASTFLESYLFYSGFFYPLYLAGQGRMVRSGEVINLIIRDESIHGVFVGMLAQELFATFDEETQDSLRHQTLELLEKLHQNELKYSGEVYGEVGLVEPVNDFLCYNGNKALMNLGYEPYFEEVTINPIVENGLKTNTKNHDFFSVKGNGYVKATNIEEMKDDDFAELRAMIANRK